VAPQLKQEHELIESGPYRHVRHPIYSGLLLAFLGTTVMIGEWRALLAFVVVLGSFLYKYRVEEGFLQLHFGDRYHHYAARTGALLPWTH
jgi:protein-S-isoprenylcysteine O-methyltransferase Ste14